MTALITEALRLLTGTGALALGAETAWRPDGGLIVTTRRGRVRKLPSEFTARLRAWLQGRFADGATADQARIELLAVLGAELTPQPATAHPRLAGALAALANLWAAQHTAEHTRGMIRSFVRECLAADPSLRPEAWPALPAPARELARLAAPSDRGLATDPYAALRPSAQVETVRRVRAGLAALTTAAAGPPEQVTALAIRLAEPVRRLAAALDEAAIGWDQRMRARQAAARAAGQRAAALGPTTNGPPGRAGRVPPVPDGSATRERLLRDRWAPDRARAREAEASQEWASAGRNRRIAAAYRLARDRARAAARAHQAVAQDLEDLPAASLSIPDPVGPGPVDRVLAVATAAQGTYQRYLAAVAAAQPVALEAAVPPGELPCLGALTDAVNGALASHGVAAQFRPEDLRQLVLSRWRFVAGADGAVVPISGGAVELRVRFAHRDPVEVLTPPQQTSQLIVAQLPQFPKGTRVVGAARHFRLGREVGQRLSDWLTPLLARAVPDSLIEALPGTGGRILLGVRDALRFAVARIAIGLVRHLSIASTGATLTLPGRVADNRGPSTLYDVTGPWVVQVRPAEHGARWSPELRVETPAAGDRVGLPLWVAHGYTDRPPAGTVRIDPRSLPAGRRFPSTYSLASLTGLPDLYDRTLALLGPVGVGARREVGDLIWQELPAWLDQSIADPDLLQRAIYDDGRLIGIVGYRAEVDIDAVRPLGGLSHRHFVETVLVDFAEYSGRTVHTGGRFLSGVLGARLQPDTDGVPMIGLRYSPGVNQHRANTAYTAAIHPDVRRETGASQGMLVPLTITVSVKRYDTGMAAESPPLPARAVVRAPVTSLYRCGMPVATAAARRDRDGELLRRHGRVVLFDDPIPGPPAGRSDRPADWLGHRGGIRIAPGYTQNLTGVDTVRHRVEEWLRARGWLPPIGADGWPVLSPDPLVAAGELANLRTVREQITPLRLEGAFDQVAQDGIPLRLVRHAVNRSPQHLLLWLRVRQNPSATRLIGHTAALTPVYLEIGAHQFQREAGQARSRAAGVEAGSAYDLSAMSNPVASAFGGIGRLLRRTTALTWRAGFRRHRVFIAEGAETGFCAVFRTTDTLEVVRKRDHGQEEPVARGPIAGEWVLPAGLLAPAEAAEPVPATAVVSAEVLRRARILNASNQGAMVAARHLTGAQPGSPGYEYLAAAINVRHAVANGALLTTGQDAEFGLDPRVDRRRWSLRQIRLSVRGLARELRFVAAEDLILIDGELAMDTFGRTTTVEQAHEVAGSGQIGFGGPAGAGGGTAARTGFFTAAQTRQQIAAEETLHVTVGIQYLFQVTVAWTLTAFEHFLGRRSGRPRRSRTVRGAALLAIPEPEALALYARRECRLPLDQVSDALIRYATGRLDLDPELVGEVRARFRSDRVGAGLTADPPPPPAEPRAPAPAIPASPAASGPADSDPLPEHLDRAVGLSWFERARLAEVPSPGQPRCPDPSHGTEALLGAVSRAVEMVVPGANDRSPVIRQTLAGQLSGDAWRGLLRRMLDRGEDPAGAGGVTIVVELPYGRYWSEPVEIHLRARIGGARLVGRDSTMLIRQNYQMSGLGHAATIGTRWGWSGNAGGHTADLAAAIGRGYLSTSSRQETNTDLQRLGALHDGTARYARDLTIDVMVRRRRPRVLRRTSRRMVALLGRASPPELVRTRLRGTVVQVVPRGWRRSEPGSWTETGGGAGRAPLAPDARPVVLPDMFATEDFDARLRAALRPYLVDRLGEAWTAELDPALNAQLSRLSLTTMLRRMAAPAGHPALELPIRLRPGEHPRILRATVHAQLTEPRLVAQWGRTELGHDTREETVVGRTLFRDRLFPVGRGLTTGGLAETAGGIFTGQSASESEGQKLGGRTETKLFTVDRGVTVSARADLFVTVETVALLPTGAERVEGRQDLGLLATGRAYLTMHRPAYEQMRARMAASSHRDAWCWLLDGRAGSDELATRRRFLRRWLGEGWAGRRVAPLPVLDLDDLLGAAAQPPDHPELHLRVAGELRRRLGERCWRAPGVIHLTASVPNGPGADPLRLALLLARERGGEIMLDLCEPDGVLRRYRAVPRGPDRGGSRLIAEFPDGGFAAAHAALDPDLVARAARAGLDLAGLFHRLRRAAPGTSLATPAFAEVVESALDPAPRRPAGAEPSPLPGHPPEPPLATPAPIRSERPLSGRSRITGRPGRARSRQRRPASPWLPSGVNLGTLSRVDSPGELTGAPGS